MDKLQAVVERRLWESRWLEQEVIFLIHLYVQKAFPHKQMSMFLSIYSDICVPRGYEKEGECMIVISVACQMTYLRIVSVQKTTWCTAGV